MHEGLGLVYLEAMAVGKAVITYDHGGQTDFLTHGDTGYLVRSGNADGLAKAISRAIDHPEEVAAMGDANLLRAPQHRIDRCARAYETLFEHVAAERPAPFVSRC